ncbi:hypothetical protein N7517_000569 [Penicillium concentricum]|uniref:Uncharacterized protein n=1 Tax=Penicillium concentricum TaxID=293559 RepID=A0A9W9VHQ0_9EURO|nr:uncharacterized protein N7517_000569 [Penicillium concentricum]KAJ5382658.1 hypothetical protein N7517_000569 [Penicillium concentricum]
MDPCLSFTALGKEFFGMVTVKYPLDSVPPLAVNLNIWGLNLSVALRRCRSDIVERLMRSIDFEEEDDRDFADWITPSLILCAWYSLLVLEAPRPGGTTQLLQK